MKIKKLKLAGLFVIEPNIFYDKRGFLYETYNENMYLKLIKSKIVQVIHSHSKKNTIRGIHFQYPHLQGKLVSVIEGEIFDVGVDINRKSDTFSQWFGKKISKGCQIFIPPGYAHGYCVLSDFAIVMYKCTEYYHESDQKGIIWNDSQVDIKWPILDPIISEKDSTLPNLSK